MPDEEWVTLVVFQIAEDGSVFLQIGRPRAPHDWRKQRVQFKAEDPLTERYRALGLLAASLGAENAPEFAVEPGDDEAERPARSAKNSTESAPTLVEAESAGSEPTEAIGRSPAPTEEGGEPSSSPTTEKSRLAGQLQLGATLSQALRRASGGPVLWRPGGGVRASLGHRALPLHLEAGVGISGTPETDERLSLGFVTAEAGLSYGLLFPRADLGLRPSARVLLEQVRARARSSVLDATVEQSRWTWGLALGVGVTYPQATRLGLVMEAEYLSYDGATGIEVNGERVGRVPADNARALLGVVYRIR